MYSGNSNILDERRSVMDTKKIGTFTSMNRKKKGYTQGQLAEKLGVTIDPFLAEESGKQGNQSDTDEGHAATGHQLLHTLRLCTGVVVAVAFQKVDCTPDAKTGTQSNDEGLQNTNCGIKKCH